MQQSAIATRGTRELVAKFLFARETVRAMELALNSLIHVSVPTVGWDSIVLCANAQEIPELLEFAQETVIARTTEFALATATGKETVVIFQNVPTVVAGWGPVLTVCVSVPPRMAVMIVRLRRAPTNVRTMAVAAKVTKFAFAIIPTREKIVLRRFVLEIAPTTVIAPKEFVIAKLVGLVQIVPDLCALAPMVIAVLANQFAVATLVGLEKNAIF